MKLKLRKSRMGNDARQMFKIVLTTYRWSLIDHFEQYAFHELGYYPPTPESTFDHCFLNRMRLSFDVLYGTVRRVLHEA